MRRWCFAWWWGLAVVLAASAGAEWRQTATTATWYVTGATGSPRCTTASEVPLAVARVAAEATPWRDALATTAPMVFEADRGDGQCELRIAFALAAGTAYVNRRAPTCGAADGAGLAARSAAVDRCLKEDFLLLVHDYRIRTRPPIAEPEPLEAEP